MQGHTIQIITDMSVLVIKTIRYIEVVGTVLEIRINLE